MRPAGSRRVSVSRREFLSLAARAGLGGMALTLGGALPLRGQGRPPVEQTRRALKDDKPVLQVLREKSYREAVKFDLEAKEVTWELAPGKVIKGFGYDGQLPGRMIRARQGDLLQITFSNNLPGQDTAVHWHGVDDVVTDPDEVTVEDGRFIRARSYEDTPSGAEQLPVKAVKPGERITYQFVASPPGSRWYHPVHLEGLGSIQQDLGLYGPLIIDPTDDLREPFPSNREYMLFFDDWAAGAGRPLAGTLYGTAVGGAGFSMANMMNAMMGGSGMGPMMGGLIRGLRTPPYDTMTIKFMDGEGKTYPATEPLKVRQGERVRLRLFNSSNAFTHVIRLAGHSLQVTHTDGNPLIEGVTVDAIPIAPAERYDVQFVADRPGAYFLYCTQPGHAAAGEMVAVFYDGYEGTIPAPPVLGQAGLRVWYYTLGRGRNEGIIPPANPGQVWSFNIVLTGIPPFDVWMINGKVKPHTDLLDVREGDLVRVLITNMSPWNHPFHLHGQSFKVMAVNGVGLPNPLIKDTVDVHPFMGTVLIEFTAQFDGYWPFHCHIYPHSDGGMYTHVRVRSQILEQSGSGR